MTVSTHCHCMRFVQKGDLTQPVGLVPFMAIHTRGRSRRQFLPLRQQNMKMILKCASRFNISMAFQAILIPDRPGCAMWLNIVPAEVHQRIARPQHLRPNAPGHPTAGMTINTAHPFGSVKTRQVHRRVASALHILAFRLGMTGRTKAIMVFQGCSSPNRGSACNQNHCPNRHPSYAEYRLQNAHCHRSPFHVNTRQSLHSVRRAYAPIILPLPFLDINPELNPV